METYNTKHLNIAELESINAHLSRVNQELSEKINKQAEDINNKVFRDELTGLGNINKYNQDLDKFKYDKIAIFDITNFKLINNLYGTCLGDQFIIELSKKFMSYCRKYKLKVYSFYIDMFALVTQDTMTSQEFIHCMKQLHIYINTSSFFVDLYEVSINTNTALALNVEPLQEKAFMVLDYLKETKESFLIYSKDLKLEKEIENNFIWIKKIKKAIEDDKIVPFFQPIYNNKTKKIDKYEALIRLIDEEDKIVEPSFFLDIAKKTNLYKKLTGIMIEKTFAAFKDKEQDFSINIAVEDILDPQTRDFILLNLQLFPKPRNVILELVETENIESYPQVNDFIKSVKELGARIAIDDFGTGYSNLMYLIQLNVDIIKVDGAIIKNMHQDQYSYLVANTIMYLANNLNIETVAEYVEDKNIFNKVNDMGIHYSQGYYFSKPEKDIINI